MPSEPPTPPTRGRFEARRTHSRTAASPGALGRPLVRRRPSRLRGPPPMDRQRAVRGSQPPPALRVLQGTDIRVSPGDDVALSAVVDDPDGDAVRCHWWHYREAGTSRVRFRSRRRTGTRRGWRSRPTRRPDNDPRHRRGVRRHGRAAEGVSAGRAAGGLTPRHPLGCSSAGICAIAVAPRVAAPKSCGFRGCAPASLRRGRVALILRRRQHLGQQSPDACARRD